MTVIAIAFRMARCGLNRDDMCVRMVHIRCSPDHRHSLPYRLLFEIVFLLTPVSSVARSDRDIPVSVRVHENWMVALMMFSVLRRGGETMMEDVDVEKTSFGHSSCIRVLICLYVILIDFSYPN